MGIKIKATGRALGSRLVGNAELAAFLDTNDEWITSKTGIKTRSVLSNESLTDLAFRASGTALEKASLAPNDIDYIIASTLCGDFLMPSLACAVSERLCTKCPAFDLNAACTGFVYALDSAAAYIDSGRAENVLIISADAMSRHVNWEDRSVCVLFGDAAGAAVVTKGDSLKYMRLAATGETTTIAQSFGTGNSPFERNKPLGFLEMNGQEVFKFAVSCVEKEVPLALSTLSLSAEDIDFYLLHQANKRIIDSARKRIGVSEEKFPINIDKYGNTSSATIPILLDELIENGEIETGSMLLLAAFGAGLTTATCVLKWE